jgi:hypothetical protein
MPKDRSLDVDREEVEEYKDEAYFDGSGVPEERSFDTRLLRQPTTVLPARKPIVLSRLHSVTDAIRSMQSEHRGVVIVTEDGTANTPLLGIFTERDVLFRIVDQGRNPGTFTSNEQWFVIVMFCLKANIFEASQRATGWYFFQAHAPTSLFNFSNIAQYIALLCSRHDTGLHGRI